MKTSKQDGCLLVQLSTSKIPITFIGITETVPTNINNTLEQFLLKVTK